MIQKTVKIFLFLSVLIYGVAFVYSFTSPQTIEKNARGFIKEQVSKKTHEQIDNIGTKYKDNKLVKLSSQIFKKKKEQLALYKESLKLNIDEKLANVMTKMLDLNCECRKKYKGMFHDFIVTKITNLKTVTKTLEAFMTQKYMYVVNNIIKDFRIFLGSNFLVLFLMLILLYSKPQETKKINLLAGWMFIFTLLSSYLYLFNQNWFYTILYNDFMGYLYLLSLGIIFLFLIDIIFNKGRITNVLFSSISAPSGVC